MAFGINRTPGLPARDRRNNDRLSDNDSIVDPGGAIQINVDDQIVLVIATDEPLSQSSAGLVLELDGVTIVKSSSGIKVNPNLLTDIKANTNTIANETRAFTKDLVSQTQAQAFFYGLM